MATYYVYSGATGSNNGTDWTNAYVSFASAVTAASANGDTILVAQDHAESLSTNTTYTFSANLSVISTNRTSGLPTAGAQIGSTSYGYNIALTGSKNIYIYGLNFRAGGSNTFGFSIAGSSDPCWYKLDTCDFIGVTNSASASYYGFGYQTQNQHFSFIKCNFRFNNSAQKINIYGGEYEFRECTINSGGGTAPSTLIGTNWTAAYVNFLACDVSAVTGTLIGNNTAGPVEIVFTNCKLGAGVSPLAAATSPAFLGNNTVWLFNCSSADEHYHIGHYNPLGQTTVSTSIYANDGAKYDGTNGCSWAITTTANATFTAPYESPWIDRYHSGTSAITPTLEIVRSGSSTAYNDNEVWGEFSYQGTSGYTLASIVSDRMSLLGTPAAQTTGSLTASGWTGENATAWFGKLNPTSTITPAEAGHLRARVCVGIASSTVYVDPTIRGTS